MAEGPSAEALADSAKCRGGDDAGANAARGSRQSRAPLECSTAHDQQQDLDGVSLPTESLTLKYARV